MYASSYVLVWKVEGLANFHPPQKNMISSKVIFYRQSAVSYVINWHQKASVIVE